MVPLIKWFSNKKVSNWKWLVRVTLFLIFWSFAPQWWGGTAVLM